MSADIVHAVHWDTPQKQYFVALGLGRDEAVLYESHINEAKGYTTESVSRIETADTVETFNYSPAQSGIVGVGNNQGAVHIFDFHRPALPPISLEPQQARPCNSIAFNTGGLVAVGLDRARNDESLLIWDIHYTDTSATKSSTATNQYLANESVAWLDFVVGNPPILLAATYKSIREIDVRQGTPAFHIPTKYAYGLRASPIDENLFLSYNESGTVALWDRRQLGTPGSSSPEPLLLIPRVFNEARGKAHRSIRFSSTVGNEFAVLHDGGLIRRWITSAKPAEAVTAGPVSNLSNAVKSKAPSPIVTTPLPDYSLFVWSVHDVQTEYDKVIGFDYVIDSSTKKLDFMCIRQSGQVFRMPSNESPSSLYFAPNNDLMVLQSQNLILMGDENIKNDPHTLKARKSVTSGYSSMLDQEDDDASYKSEAIEEEEEEEDDDDDNDNDEEDDNKSKSSEKQHAKDHSGLLAYEDVLQTDITMCMQKRAMAGYSSNPETNFELLQGVELSGSPVLRSAWKWLTHASRYDAEGIMATDSIDLGFGGVASIWEGLDSLAKQRRLGKASAAVTERELEGSIKSVVNKFTGSVFVDPELAKGPRAVYRQLCLRVTGWGFPLEQLESKIQELEAKGLHEKAAAWAVFHGNVERAVQSLSASRKRQLRLMSPAVAGYLLYKDVQSNNPWREQARKLASEMSMPYLRAIFAYISDGSWFDVLDDGSLPLTERLGIALRFLPDKDLSRYLTRLTNRTIQQGDLEGILLTGLTPSLVDLLQSYVDKTGDVQTASLIVAFGSPRYFSDERSDSWIAEYRHILNTWRYFAKRASFDVSRNKLSQTKSGIRNTPPVPKQAFLRCIHCKSVYGPPRQRRGKRTFSATNRCPNCNYPLPRCAICSISLGPSLQDNKEVHWPVFCLNCNHGYHAAHAKQWFAKYDVCPVPECQCRCGIL